MGLVEDDIVYAVLAGVCHAARQGARVEDVGQVGDAEIFKSLNGHAPTLAIAGDNFGSRRWSLQIDWDSRVHQMLIQSRSGTLIRRIASPVGVLTYSVPAWQIAALIVSTLEGGPGQVVDRPAVGVE